MTWSAGLYSNFEQQRTRPVRDLVAAIPATRVRTAVDLGCGPGNSTEVLLARYPEAAVTGLDSSADMLQAARARLPAVEFVPGDIATWRPADAVDVVLANASLQWLPDHAALYPRLLSYVAPGGALAVQTPDNEREPAHLLMREVADGGPWATRIAGARHMHRHPPVYYYALLAPHAREVDVWRTVYHHPLPDHRAILAWFKGSGLRPYLDPLDGDERAEFEARYLRALEQAYPALDDGSVLLPFPRTFVVATR